MPGSLQDSMGIMDVLPAGLMVIMGLVAMKVIMDMVMDSPHRQ
jgi:hypothetical protein